jgi:hypothetical protein
MEEWRSYRLSDFALFSARVYRRLFELHNEALWPWQILALALAIVLLFALARRPAHTPRIVPALLAAAWLWLAWAFFWRSYAAINWTATYMAPVAGLQCVLLLWLAARPGGLPFGPPTGMARISALGLFGASVLLYPLLAPAMGRPGARPSCSGWPPIRLRSAPWPRWQWQRGARDGPPRSCRRSGARSPERPYGPSEPRRPSSRRSRLSSP